MAGMRLGWTVSALAHLCMAGVTFLSWPQPDEQSQRGVVVTPVEIVDISDVAEVIAEAPPAPEDAAPEETSEETPTTAPTPAPTPQPQTPQNNPFDLGAVQQRLRNLENQNPGTRVPNAAPGPRTQEQVGLGQRERATIESRVAGLMQRHLQRCWRTPLDASDPRRLVVELQINLDAQGRLDGRPRVLRPTSVAGDPELRVAVDRAIRAAFQCNPYPFPDDPVVGEHYDFWRENTYVFRLEE